MVKCEDADGFKKDGNDEKSINYVEKVTRENTNT